MQAYEFVSGGQLAGLKRAERHSREPGPGEVRVGVRAVSLNYRDLMALAGTYPGAPDKPLIPACDSAGEVISVGVGVTTFKAGDRVANTYFGAWDSGEIAPWKVADSFGASIDGVLAEEIVVPQNRLAILPAHVDFTQGATFACAGVTAWNALFVAGRLKPGGSVLLLGTGGVSIWGLQLAKAAGLKAYITSSSDEKLARAKALNADGLINYRKTPEWQDEVMRLTGGQGVDMVLEVGGQGTLSRSVASLSMGGTIAAIGGVSGFGADPNFLPVMMILTGKRLEGIFVGSRSMLEDLSRFVAASGIRPVVDRVFAFDQAAKAYQYLQSGSHFGKVVIRVGS